VGINLCASIPFSKLNTLAMSLNYLKNQIQNGHDSALLLSLMLCLIIISEKELKLLLQEFLALF